jgi:hypothetical protein
LRAQRNNPSAFICALALQKGRVDCRSPLALAMTALADSDEKPFQPKRVYKGFSRPKGGIAVRQYQCVMETSAAHEKRVLACQYPFLSLAGDACYW